MADALDVLNPIQGGFRAFGGLFDDSDEQLESIDAANRRIEGAQERLGRDYRGLISDFDLGLGNYRKDSRSKRTEASNALKLALMSDTEAYVESLGPLNEVSKARLKTQMQVPVLRQLIEFDLGTTETDLNVGMSALMSSMQLGREAHELRRYADNTVARNKAARQSIADSAPSGFDKWLTGTIEATKLAAALKGAV